MEYECVSTGSGIALPENRNTQARTDGPRTFITLNRPQRAQRQSLQMVHELMAVFDACAQQNPFERGTAREGGHFVPEVTSKT